MDNAIRCIFSLVVVALLLYACVLYRSAHIRLTEARGELAALHAMEAKLREENEALTGQLAVLQTEGIPG